MKGKQNRTKNNARPSSSGRSAAMLHSTLPQFAGFSTGNKSTELPSFAFNPIEDLDASIDSNFQLVLKKVSKKDFTTKLKGLQEFADLLQSADPAIIKTLLPTWPRFYSVLATHPYNKIREATQNVHRIIVLKAKRDIAPYLKQLMATWYISQYDNYPAAASASAQAFRDTFSPVKFKEALIVYHQEILHYIHDNLLVQTAQTVSPNQYSPEEAAARYERIVTSCLQGYAMYLQEIPSDKVSESPSLSTEIVSNKKFWKLAQSKDCLIKSSWFQVLSVLLQKAVHLLAGKEAQTLTTILNSLDEEEAVVLPRIWECLLLATATPEWWKFVNVDQVFIPKVFNVLKQGGRGNAAVVYPNFLPLLSNWPPMDEKKRKQIWTNFFDNMTSGLKLKSVVSNSQETTEIAVCYTECLQFLITRNIANIPLCKFFIKHLCTVLEWCLMTEAVLYRIVFGQASNLMQNLTKNKETAVMQVVVEHFFSSLFDLFSRLLNKPHAAPVITKQVELVLYLQEHQKGALSNQFYSHALEQFVLKIFEMYIQYIEQTSLSELFEPLFLLIKSFDKEMIFQFALKQLKADSPKLDYMAIYNSWFKRWLKSEKMYCPSLLDLVFLLFEKVDELNKYIILNDLMEVEHPNSDTWTVARALQEPYVLDPVLQKWLQGDKVSAFFGSIVHDYISTQCSSENVDIFKQALAENAQGTLLMSDEALNAIQTEIAQTLIESEGHKSLDAACELACHLCEIIYTEKHHTRYEDQLLLNLFNVSFKFDDDHLIAQETVSKVNSTWTKSLSVLLDMLNQADCEKLLEKFVRSLEDDFRSIIVTKRRGHFHYLSDRILKIWEAISNSDVALCDWILEFLLNKSNVSQNKVITLCKVADFIKGTLHSPNEELIVQESIREEEMLSYFINIFMAIAIVPNMEVGSSEALDAVYSHTICDRFLGHFNNIKHYQEISYYNMCSWQVDQSLIGSLDDLLEAKYVDCGWFWNRTAPFGIQAVEQSSMGAVQIFRNNSNEDFEIIFQEVEDFRKQIVNTSFYESNELSWQESHKLIKWVKSCRKLVANPQLPQKHWDVIVVALVLWTENCKKSKRLFKTVQYQAMLVSVSDLYITICKKVANLNDTQDDSSYVHEWADVLFDDIHNDLVQIWLNLAENFSNCPEGSLPNLPFLQCFGQVTDWFKHDLILQLESPKWPKLLKLCSDSLLTNSQNILQLWGYKMLLTLVPGLVKIDENSVSATTPNENGLIFEQFKDKLIEMQDIVNSMLMDFRVGENGCKVEPSYDSYTYTLAYLMLWEVLITLCDQASPELRFQYSDWLRKESYLYQFLSNLFKLMSTEDLQLSEAKAAVCQSFLTHPLDSAWNFRFCGSETIVNLARYLYKSSLEQFPVLVRQWWTSLDNKSSQIVEKVSVTYVSPHICNVELNNVLKHQDLFKNLKVKVMPIVREIQAVYTVDEAQMELTMTLPVNYPLGSPDIACNRQISGSIQKQLLQFKKCILHQNGKIWDGLSLWNANLDKKFEAIEECYICYSVLHLGTYQFPKLSCRMCKKKFHSACLYKWFNTSRKSSCPICRNLF